MPKFSHSRIRLKDLNRRCFLKLIGAGAAVSSLPGCSAQATSGIKMPADFYQVPMRGDARILHITDVHGQLNPVYFREPNVNLGVGDAFGRLPHLVGKNLLAQTGLSDNSPESYAYTYLNFESNAKKYGPTGGFAQLKTLLDQLRQSAGGQDKTITIDGGDLWQGSGTSLWTRGVDMVEASNILGIDVMVGHWEFTYRENEVLSNVALFKGDFIGQNVRVKEEALFGDNYYAMVEKYDGRGLFNEDSSHAFRPYVIKDFGGVRVAIIGQAFPRTANAHPQEFFPDWSFGLREEDMNNLVADIRANEKPDAVILLSHNGMDVDIKMAERVAGLNAVFGGHTHDGIPTPLKIKNADGKICWVTNAGSNGKYVGVMDFDISNQQIAQMHYTMLPVISNWIKPDREMNAYIEQMRSTVYTDKIIESRSRKYQFNPKRLGQSFAQILSEKLAIADRTLYRRGNFMGTWDQVICNALRHEYQADVALSPGVRWGPTTPEGHWITMEDVMGQCSMTYAESYLIEMTGQAIVSILEGVADNLFDPDPYLQSGGDMVRVGGLDYRIEPGKPLNQRISRVRFDNGDPIDLEKKYQVAGWATVNRVPEGRLVWDIVRDYILATRHADLVLRLPKINYPELVGVIENPGIADYPGQAS